MKREIKFRAWSEDLSEYRKLDDFSNHQGLGMGFEVEKGIGNNVTSIYHSINDVVEQYTGLHDNNGREIYEGDIVQVTSEDGEFYVAAVKWFGDEGYPAFDLAGIPAAWCYESNALATIFEGSFEICEVIGNVHENPELLEEQ